MASWLIHALGVLGGLLITLYGHNYATTMLVYQAVSLSGGPILQRAVVHLLKTYRQTRAAMEDEGKPWAADPSFAAKVTSQRGDLDAALQRGQITKDVRDAEVASLYATLSALYPSERDSTTTATAPSAATGALSSLRVLVESLEEDKVKTVLLSFYISVTSAVATVLNGGCAKAAVGVRLGHSVSDMSLRLVRWQAQLPQKWRLWSPSVRDPWLKAGVEACGAAVGLAFAFGSRSVASDASFALLGAQMAVDSAQKLWAPRAVGGSERLAEPLYQGLVLVLVLTAVSLKLRVPAATSRRRMRPTAYIVHLVMRPLAIIDAALMRFTGKTAAMAAAAAAMASEDHHRHSSSPERRKIH